jgi:phage terminase large subunit-like protein
VAELIPPTFESYPKATTSAGIDAVELAASAGLILDPWQEYALDRILAEDAEGRPAAFEAALIVPRQNGKGSVLEALSLYWLFVADVPLILHSAHEFKTAAEGFRRLRTLIQGAPKLADLVEKVTTAAGNEAIELFSGQRLRYVARSKGSGRGFTGGKVILDEAYALEDEEMAALLPTMATQPDAQVVYTSSAGMSSSSQLRSVRDRGRKGGDPSLCYLEWGGQPIGCGPRRCVHDLDDETCSLNDRDRWRGDNPGTGIRITVSFIAKERRALTPEAFARERLGVWDESLGESPIPMAAWTACADLESKDTGTVVFGVDVSPSLRSAAVAVAGWRTDGLAHGELAKHEPGVDWLAGELARIVKAHRPAAVVGHGTAQLKALVPSLEAAGVDVTLLTDGDMAAACSQLQSEVAEGGFRHLGDPILADALGNAASKPVGDGGWVWRRKGSEGDITPLVALNAARWGLQTVPKASVPLIAWR